ncbi:MAG: hypothetical protein Q4B42_01725, partial [Oscillospiraceae bacterium]|nr:hypothetical protein [Oscillospiraceae bacterium]
ENALFMLIWAYNGYTGQEISYTQYSPLVFKNSICLGDRLKQQASINQIQTKTENDNVKIVLLKGKSVAGSHLKV